MERVSAEQLLGPKHCPGAFGVRDLSSFLQVTSEKCAVTLTLQMKKQAQGGAVTRLKSQTEP